jgi:hypothetical protein
MRFFTAYLLFSVVVVGISTYIGQGAAAGIAELQAGRNAQIEAILD